jgi:uncharacterized OB-fold protein
MEMSTAKAWRLRGALTRRSGFPCAACGRFSLVRRARCGACGAPAGETPEPLPASGVVEASTSAGIVLERLDQARARRVAVLLQLGGARLACLLADEDAPLASRLRGRPVRLTVRRIGWHDHAGNEPVRYGMKAVADLATRRELHRAK